MQTRAGGCGDTPGAAWQSHSANFYRGPSGAGRPMSPVGLGPSGAGTPLPAQHMVTHTWPRKSQPQAPPSSTGTPTVTLQVSTCAPAQTARARVSHTEHPTSWGEGPFSPARLLRRRLLSPPRSLRPKVPLPQQSRAEARACPPARGTAGQVPTSAPSQTPLQATGHLPGPLTTKVNLPGPPNPATRGS